MRYLFFYIIFPLTIVCASKEAYADFYKYVDEKGTVNMTNDINSVPDKYKPSMKVIKEIPRKEPPPHSDEEPLITIPEVEEEKVVPNDREAAPSIFQSRYFKSGTAILTYAIGIFLSYMFVVRHLSRRRLNIVLLLLMTGALAVYLLKVETNEAYNKFTDMKEKVNNVQKKLEKNASDKATAMKDLSEIIKETN